MDNDNPLLEKARNLYKGWRFGWKYRGVPVLEAQAGNDLLASMPDLRWRCPLIRSTTNL